MRESHIFKMRVDGLILFVRYSEKCFVTNRFAVTICACSSSCGFGYGLTYVSFHALFSIPCYPYSQNVFALCRIYDVRQNSGPLSHWIVMMTVRILIADDNEVFRSRLVEIMDGHDGWNVCAAVENGQDAVAKAKELKPDAVILDLAMPVMDGLTATREILRNEPTVPVFIYTLHNIPAIELEAKKAGARKMVLKPHVEVLIRAIKETLANEAQVPDASSAPAAAIPGSPANQNAAATETILANQPHDEVVIMSAAPSTAASAPDSAAAPTSTTDGAGTNSVVADGDSAAPPAMGDPEPSS